MEVLCTKCIILGLGYLINQCNLLTLNIFFFFLLLFIHCEAEYEHFTDNMFHSNTYRVPTFKY